MSKQVYNKKFKMEKLCKTMFDPAHVSKWDKNIKTVKTIPLVEGKRCFSLSYTLNKQQYSIAGRDFYEKQFNFFHNGKFYRYSSSIDNSEIEGPNGEPAAMPSPDDKTVRAFTAINCGVVQRGPKSELKFTMFCQIDWKIKVPSFILTSFFPKAAKEWNQNVNKYYTKNQKNM